MEIYRYVTEGSFDAYMWQALETKARFINQVMTGDLTVRQAEDIGGQELSYAEVKAIASGNPAVLTLAETDAEIKRLHVLKKNPADEQYMARKRVKELPEKIERLEQRISGLGEDIATANAHERDPVTIGARHYAKEDVQEALAAMLKGVDMVVFRNRRIPLGIYHGLKFSLDLSPRENPSVCVEGTVTRFLELSRENPGPRAMMNAVARLVDSYEHERSRATKDLEISRGQLRDYQSRIGNAFSHDGYLEELTGLRNQLEGALSSTTQAHDTDELVQQIKALRAANTIEASPERTAQRKTASMEESVTTRIMRGRVAMPEPEQIEIPVQEKPAEIMTFKRPAVSKPKATYREKVEGDKRQLSLF